ncbi:MAG: CHAT domain-containing protein [Thermoanaerobaculia bacterium]
MGEKRSPRRNPEKCGEPFSPNGVRFTSRSRPPSLARNGTSATNATLVAFGDPRPGGSLRPAGLDGGYGSVAARAQTFPPIPATREEVESVASSFGGRSEKYVGQEATEERVGLAGPKTRYLHFACHAVLDSRFPLDSALVLSPFDVDHPGGENGLLQAWEIYGRGFSRWHALRVRRFILEDPMNRVKKLAIVAVVGMLGFVNVASAQKGHDKGKGQGKEKQDKQEKKEEHRAKKQEHKNGKQLVGEKIKTNGHHVIHKKGDYETAVEVKNGKIAGVHVKHAKKGDVPVKKYKSTKKMAQRRVVGQADGISFASLEQAEYIGTTYIGYAYIDEYGYEEIYWFPYDMILDGDTGAIEYVPAY